ncbi:SLC13 family permease [Virgibacillus phasianinus]|uniref:SLC13 family permease n=1 Tax=Virgibacillus phasianinus TaxID=2017483 RepID=UPI001FE7B2D4|nr:SLC13 family permease [Virgibacillus phasianinus]
MGVILINVSPESIDKKVILGLIDEQIYKLGKITLDEKKVIIIIGLTLLLWSTQQLHHLSIPLIGLLGAALTFTPLIGVWKWDDAKKSIDWDMILFFASTIMVSGMLINTGTVGMIADILVTNISLESSFAVLLILVCCTAILRIIFVNILGFLTIVLPLAITIGETIPNLSPLLVTMAVFLAGIPGFLLITQSPVHLITYSYNYFTEKDLFKIGGVSMIIWSLIIVVTTSTYWKII